MRACNDCYERHDFMQIKATKERKKEDKQPSFARGSETMVVSNVTLRDLDIFFVVYLYCDLGMAFGKCHLPLVRDRDTHSVDHYLRAVYLSGTVVQEFPTVDEPRKQQQSITMTVASPPAQVSSRIDIRRRATSVFCKVKASVKRVAQGHSRRVKDFTNCTYKFRTARGDACLKC
eukprot:CFRG6729T1